MHGIAHRGRRHHRHATGNVRIWVRRWRVVLQRAKFLLFNLELFFTIASHFSIGPSLMGPTMSGGPSVLDMTHLGAINLLCQIVRSGKGFVAMGTDVRSLLGVGAYMTSRRKSSAAAEITDAHSKNSTIPATHTV